MTVEGRPLGERIEGFNYDYRMQCHCGGFVRVPADVYWDKAIVNGGGVPCGACGDAIEVGWEATAPRDPDDPALSNDNVAGLAWYHTSTFAEWPSPGYGEVVGAQLRQFASTMPATEFARMVKREQTKALHVGTYESAIENMLRRMHDQDDANSDFYLHRVALRLPDTAIPDGYRHESHEDASDLTLDDLGEFLAVRYLNVREAPGSFSHAIHPDAIGNIQTLALPQETQALTPPPYVIDAISDLDAELAAARAAMPDTAGIDPIALRMRCLTARKNGDELAMRINELNHEMHYRRAEFTGLLALTYLPGVGTVVREHFIEAMRGHQADISGPWTARSFHDHFRAHSAALTRPREILAQITSQPPRNLAT